MSHDFLHKKRHGVRFYGATDYGSCCEVRFFICTFNCSNYIEGNHNCVKDTFKAFENFKNK